LDGTLLIKPNEGFQRWVDHPAACFFAVAKVNALEKAGHKIILMTARKESHREVTEKQLLSLGFCWDLLIMGCTNGERVIVNDGPCSAMRVETNVDWSSVSGW
jgi:hypothetical protein